MKYKVAIFALSSLVIGHMYASETPSADKFIGFRTMENEHKTDWFNYMKKMYNDKFDMLARVHNEWVTYSNENSKQWLSCKGTPEDKERIFADQLKRAVTLHQKHNGQFKDMAEKHYQAAEALRMKHEKQLNTFLGIVPEETKKEEAAKSTKA